MINNIGRVAVVYRKDWNPATSNYEYLDEVFYNGSTYRVIVKTAVPAGTLPTNTDFYGPISKKGDTGPTGANAIAGFAVPSTNPGSGHFIGKTYSIDTYSYGSTFTYFNNITVPAKVGAKYVSNARFVFNNATAWDLQYELLDVPADGGPVIVGGTFSLGLANNTFTTAIGSNGTRMNVADGILYNSMLSTVSMWVIKAGPIEYKLFKPNPNGGNPIQYFNKTFTCVLGLNTFTAGVDFDSPVVLKGTTEGWYGATTGTGQVGTKDITGGGALLSSNNMVNDETSPLFTTSTKGSALSATYIAIPVSDDVTLLKVASKFNTKAQTNSKTTGYPNPVTHSSKAIDATTGALIDSPDFDVTEFTVFPGESITLTSQTGANISNVIGLATADGTPLPRLQKSTPISADPATYTIPETATKGYYYHGRKTSTITDYRILITFNDRSINEISKITTDAGQTFDLSQVKRDIAGLKANPSNPYFLARPSNGIVNFQVSVNCAIPDTTTQTTATQDAIDNFLDWGILQLPTNYSRSGSPIKLIIGCHGTGTWINGATSSQTADAFWLSQGYALLDMNGIPAGYDNPSWNPTTPDYSDNGNRHYGAPFALQSYLKGYEYVLKNYNIASNGCFVYGISMGGLSSNMIVQSGSIPVLAQGGFAPCLDHFKQAYNEPWNDGTIQRAKIAKYFGFEGTAPTFNDTKPVPTAQKDFYISNINKVLGYNPILKNVSMVSKGIATTGGIYATMPSVTTGLNATEQLDYDNFSKNHRVPFKIWHNVNDPIVKYRYSKYFAEMAKREGCLVELRMFPSGSHNAWLNGAVVSGIPTVDGGTISIETSMYECYLWFKRFSL